MDMPNDILRDAREALSTDPHFRTAQDDGRYASRVRINAAHGSSWNGRIGTVARVTEGVPFVRFPVGRTRMVTVPFGFADLEELK
jgi:hypothetical protein